MKYEKHVFVCLNERVPEDPRGCCTARGGQEVHARLKALAARHGLKGKVRINKAGCLDCCAAGPTLVVYPEGVFYGKVTPEDAEEIFHKHILGGEPVERLRI